MNTLQKSLGRLNNLTWVHLVLIAVSLSGGYLLWARYQEQLYSFLPYLILLLCPLMHIFMHRGHGGGGNHKDHRGGQE